MRVVVFGATGNVGSRVVAALAGDPAVEFVVGVARRRPTVTVAKVKWVSRDIAVDPLEDLIRGADAVIHLAWLIQPVRDRELLRQVNVEGTRRVVDTTLACGVPRLIYASSIGAYAPDDSGIPRAEDWPTSGIPTSVYSQHKAEVEALLDEATQNAATRIVRMRMALVFQQRAAAEIARYFLGPFAPVRLIGRYGLPLFPHLDGITVQVVHAGDAANAYLSALHNERARGPYNIAASAVLSTRDLAAVFGGRPIPLPKRLVHAAASATFALRLQPTSPGWVDLAFQSPVMDIGRATSELGWLPTHTATGTVAELRDGFRSGTGTTTPPLRTDRNTLPFPHPLQGVPK